MGRQSYKLYIIAKEHDVVWEQRMLPPGADILREEDHLFLHM